MSAIDWSKAVMVAEPRKLLRYEGQSVSLDNGLKATLEGPVWRDREGVPRRTVVRPVGRLPDSDRRQEPPARGRAPLSIFDGWHRARCEDGRCGSGWCPVCASGRVRKALKRYEAVHMVDRARLRFLTCTRTHWTRTAEGFERFALACRSMDLTMRACGVEGVVWVFEVKCKSEDARVRCCGGLACPMCRGGKWIPSGHLHAHALMSGGPQWLPYKRLQGARSARELDASWGTLDVRKGDVKHFGYLSPYVSKIKETEAAGWLRAVAPSRKMVRATGSFRGRARKVPGATSVELEGRIREQLWLVRRTAKLSNLRAGFRDLRRDAKAAGFGMVPSKRAVEMDMQIGGQGWPK